MPCLEPEIVNPDETYHVRVPITGAELLALRNDLEWSDAVFDEPSLRSMMTCLGIKLQSELARRIIAAAWRLQR